MTAIEKEQDFEKMSFRGLSTSDRIRISKEAKQLVLTLNEIYKKNQDSSIMDLMKRITAIKKRVEKRLLKVPRI